MLHLGWFGAVTSACRYHLRQEFVSYFISRWRLCYVPPRSSRHSAILSSELNNNYKRKENNSWGEGTFVRGQWGQTSRGPHHLFVFASGSSILWVKDAWSIFLFDHVPGQPAEQWRMEGIWTAIPNAARNAARNAVKDGGDLNRNPTCSLHSSP